ncbi:MAG: OmpA family protein [Pseudomonadota bacterium]
MTSPLEGSASGEALSETAEDQLQTLREPRDRDLDALRALLLEEEREALEALRMRLDDPAVRAEEIARVLPEAIAIRAARDARLARTLQGTIDDALEVAVARDPKRISDAIFPVLGPALRKAVSSTLFGMVESLNEMLRQSLTLQAIRWRWAAWRSGRPYAEIVLLNTLVYQVEQVALVHAGQGVVLTHVEAPTVVAQDSDLVYGMLNAIQTFMADAFDPDAGALDVVRMEGGLSLWIEEAGGLVLALLIRGNPPPDLRERVQAALETMVASHGRAVAGFDGDTTPFAALDASLESLLERRLATSRSGPGPLAWVLTLLLLAAPILWLGNLLLERRELDAFAAKLSAEPGILVMNTEHRDGRLHVQGLRDPLAADPEAALAAQGVDPARVVLSFGPYHALDERFVLARANALLEPPESVTMSLRDGTLAVRGSTNAAWAAHLKARAAFVPGVGALNTDELVVADRDALRELVRGLEAQALLAPKGVAELVSGQEAAISATVDGLRSLEQAQEREGFLAAVLILGFTDPTGTRAYNERLSEARARYVAELLIQRGVSPGLLVPAGRGVVSTTDAAASPAEGRYITFRVLGPPWLHRE